MQSIRLCPLYERKNYTRMNKWQHLRWTIFIHFCLLFLVPKHSHITDSVIEHRHDNLNKNLNIQNDTQQLLRLVPMITLLAIVMSSGWVNLSKKKIIYRFQRSVNLNVLDCQHPILQTHPLPVLRLCPKKAIYQV